MSAAFTFLLVSAWIDEPDGYAAPTQAISQTAAYYPNCAAARSVGAAPLYPGDPGYRDQLDRDNDGVACEPYRGY